MRHPRFLKSLFFRPADFKKRGGRRCKNAFAGQGFAAGKIKLFTLSSLENMEEVFVKTRKETKLLN